MITLAGNTKPHASWVLQPHIRFQIWPVKVNPMRWVFHPLPVFHHANIATGLGDFHLFSCSYTIAHSIYRVNLSWMYTKLKNGAKREKWMAGTIWNREKNNGFAPKHFCLYPTCQRIGHIAVQVQLWFEDEPIKIDRDQAVSESSIFTCDGS